MTYQTGTDFSNKDDDDKGKDDDKNDPKQE